MPKLTGPSTLESSGHGQISWGAAALAAPCRVSERSRGCVCCSGPWPAAMLGKEPAVFPVACSLSLAQPPTRSWVRPHLRQGGQVLLGRAVELTPVWPRSDSTWKVKINKHLILFKLFFFIGTTHFPLWSVKVWSFLLSYITAHMAFLGVEPRTRH